MNYEKLRTVTEEKDENLVHFYSWLEEAFRKYTDVGPSFPTSIALIGHFMSQSALDSRHKLQKLHGNSDQSEFTTRHGTYGAQ